MKFKLLIPFLFASLISFGQDIFPAYDTAMISGKELKVKPLSEVFQRYGYEGFFQDERLKKKFECCDGINSKYKSLVNKIFKVVEIHPYTDNINQKKYKIKLSNTETGNIYFDYDPRYKHNWNFEFVGDYKVPDGFFCRGIEMIVDKFTGDTTYITPFASGFSFVKVIRAGNKTIYIRKNQPGNSLNVNEKGLILLLENGKRIEKSEAIIDVKPSSYGSGYVYSVFEELTYADIELLLNNLITDSRLYIYDGTTNKEDAKTLVEYLKCIKDK